MAGLAHLNLNLNLFTLEITAFENAVEQITALSPDLVLLDLNLPKISGFQICQNLKQKTSIPVLVLTSRDQLQDELQALKLGADEYLTKPCRKERLLARILAILSLLLNKSVIFTLGICITLIAIAAIWIIYGIFRKCAKNLWRAFGFALLVLIPVPIAITHISACFLPQVQFDFTSDIFNSGITLALSLVCFGVDYLHYHKKGDASDKK